MRILGNAQTRRREPDQEPDVSFQPPRFPLSYMLFRASIVIAQALSQIICPPCIKSPNVDFALENVNVIHSGLPSRSSLRWRPQGR
jgi:hypothetical protein